MNDDHDNAADDKAILERLSSSAPVTEAEQMVAEVRAVLAAFDWERDDRQYALEKIEQIVTGDETGAPDKEEK